MATFHGLGVSLQRIRRARAYAKQVLTSQHPFVEHRWLTEGAHVLLDLRDIEGDAKLGRLIVADPHGQEAWQEMVSQRFAEFDYENGLALIWHVRGRRRRVVIDPWVAFGAPTIKGIPTWAVKGRWDAGETVEDIQEDFRLETQGIKEALEFEGVKLAA